LGIVAEELAEKYREEDKAVMTPVDKNSLRTFGWQGWQKYLGRDSKEPHL